MTNEEFDRRLDRITERHKALSQTVEHMARQGGEQNIRIEKLTSAMESLVHVAELPQSRLDNLEGRL